MLGNTIEVRKGHAKLSSAATCLLATVVAITATPAWCAESTGAAAQTGSDTAAQQSLDNRSAGGADTTSGASPREVKATGADQSENATAPKSTQSSTTAAPAAAAPQVNSAATGQSPAQSETPAAAVAPVGSAAAGQPAADAAGQSRSPKVIWKPGLELSAGTDADDLVPTDDVELARKQVAAYPDNPEASFILAVALTRTSRVEEALLEVRRARRLADAKGGPAYFDKMIASYEEMVKHHPKENRVRYGLAWAYYMKAYMVAKASRRAAKAAAAQAQAAAGTPAPEPKKQNVWELAAAAANGKMPANPPHIEGALAKADPSAHPQIKKYHELAIGKLNELLAQKPDDVWARVYRAFVKAEYTGNIEEAMKEWRECQAQAPNNPAPYFFLGEAYLKQGNLKECINNISKAIALRAIGN